MYQINLADVKILQENPEKIEEVVKYDTFWKFERHLYHPRHNATPTEIEIFYDDEKIKSFLISDFENHNILGDILMDTVTRWGEFVPNTSHLYRIRLH
jgi:hypothetical protein